MSDKTRVHVYISGRVQGVFFRVNTRDEARKLGLTGWVKNLPDGRVEAVFEGDKQKIEEILDFCKLGPEAASVTGVDIDWEEPTGEFDGFEVRY